jgi:hypothetical protein
VPSVAPTSPGAGAEPAGPADAAAGPPPASSTAAAAGPPPASSTDASAGGSANAGGGAPGEAEAGQGDGGAHDEEIRAALAKPEEKRTDADWELLATAFESEHDHLAQVAHDAGADLEED